MWRLLRRWIAPPEVTADRDKQARQTRRAVRIDPALAQLLQNGQRMPDQKPAVSPNPNPYPNADRSGNFSESRCDDKLVINSVDYISTILYKLGQFANAMYSSAP